MAFLFLLCILPQVFCVPFKRAHNIALKINQFWAWAFFKLALIPIKTEWRFRPEKGQQFILCANHFSYLDIPALGLYPKNFKFVGKSQLNKIPLFGYMYNNLHITVNRSSYRSRAKSLEKARNAVRDGFNLGFFPEGGIRLKNFPKMVNFHDGAFRIAAENNLPIIPVTFLDNYNILRDDEILNMRRMRCRIIYHSPVWPKDNSEEGIRDLKEEVHQIIQNQLNDSYELEALDKV